MDKKLRAYLFKEYYESKGLTHLDIENLKHKGISSYTSGKKISFNDILIHIRLFSCFSERKIGTKCVFLHVDEIEGFCEKHRILNYCVFDAARFSMICKNEDVEKIKDFYNKIFKDGIEWEK